MPEVTPVWIDGWYDTHAEAAESMRGMTLVVGLEGVPTPALTMDQIEAWLRREVRMFTIHGDTGGAAIEYLLAQVQAWRKGDGHE